MYKVFRLCWIENIWSIIVISAVAKQLKAGCCLTLLKFVVFRQASKAWFSGNKNFWGPFTWYPNEFCWRTSSYRLPHDTRVKFVRNELFLSEFIGVSLQNKTLLMNHLLSFVDQTMDSHPGTVVVCGGDLNQLNIKQFERLTGWNALVDFPTRGESRPF